MPWNVECVAAERTPTVVGHHVAEDGDGVDGPDVPAMSFFPYETDPAGGAANTKGLQK